MYYNGNKVFIGNYNEINLYFKMDYKCKEDF